MTYASINEAWGGVSGNNQLSTPLTQRMHPIHLQKMEKEEKAWKTSNDLYQCNYGSHQCEQSVAENNKFNQQKKAIAQGTQPFLPGSPGPQNYTFLPQYPWHPWAKQGYLMYPPELSQMWYSNPWMVNPYVSNQIQQQQLMGNTGPMVPMGPYQPQGFLPLPYRHSMDPPGVPSRPYKISRRENFSNDKAVGQGMIYFIFFLVSMAVVLAIVMICLSCGK